MRKLGNTQWKAPHHASSHQDMLSFKEITHEQMKMDATALALTYLDIFYSGKNPELLRNIFHSDFQFYGPLYTFDSADEYIHALKENPAVEMEYSIQEIFENKDSVCLLYEFRKKQITLPMAQFFEINHDRISKIQLIFDASKFKS